MPNKPQTHTYIHTNSFCIDWEGKCRLVNSVCDIMTRGWVELRFTLAPPPHPHAHSPHYTTPGQIQQDTRHNTIRPKVDSARNQSRKDSERLTKRWDSRRIDNGLRKDVKRLVEGWFIYLASFCYPFAIPSFDYPFVIPSCCYPFAIRSGFSTLAARKLGMLDAHIFCILVEKRAISMQKICKKYVYKFCHVWYLSFCDWYNFTTKRCIHDWYIDLKKSM